jgi:outer membrane protein OmpA-like peptidoglycan-associated protein
VPALPTEQPGKPPASTVVPAQAPSPLPLPPPVRLLFAEGKTDLTPADEAAIRDLARAIPAPAADSVNVVAYAAGKPDDPSTARRLSLSRGIAVRSVLLASGVPSAQIYVRAMGATAPDAPADRVELTVAPIGTVTR